LFTVAAQDFADVGKTAKCQTHIFPSVASEKQSCANDENQMFSIRSRIGDPTELRALHVREFASIVEARQSQNSYTATKP
jgi:hypothetical protein